MKRRIGHSKNKSSARKPRTNRLKAKLRAKNRRRRVRVSR